MIYPILWSVARKLQQIDLVPGQKKELGLDNAEEEQDRLSFNNS